MAIPTTRCCLPKGSTSGWYANETMPRRSPPEVLLDVNELADESGYVELGLTHVSPDGRLLAWSVDRDGDEVYELRFRDLGTGRDLDEVIPRSYYGGAWSADCGVLLLHRP